MATQHVVLIQVNTELTKDEIGKLCTLTGVTGNPTGTVVGLQTLVVSDTDPKTVQLTITGESGTLII